MIFFTAQVFFAVEVIHDIIHCLANHRVLRDCTESESCCRLMWQFLADAVQICCGICELLRIAIDKMYSADQWLIGMVDLLLVQIVAA